MNTDKTLEELAAKASMHEQTARKYIHFGKLPSQLKQQHTWRTRKDPFAGDWDSTIKPFLEFNSGLEAKTIFEYLQREKPGYYQDGQLRTLQRRIKSWRALEGPEQEVMFPQIHYPGILSQSDFTHMNELGITIGAVPFPHMIYHFVLTCSNWETGTVCFSESFESLSLGLQNALWTLGAVPETHQTDRLSAAAQNTGGQREFTRAYQELLDHYNLKGRKTNANSPHENGDIEQRHYRFIRALDQRLMLRGSRDFESRKDYELFLKSFFQELNMGRQAKLEEELAVMHDLPIAGRLESAKEFTVTVSQNSTIRIQHNVYSLPSRLIGYKVKVLVHAEYLAVWYARKCIEKIPRLRGEGKHDVKYYHVIDSLIKKPGAFENYKYREDMFPTSYFRMAYDVLRKQHSPSVAIKEYLSILYMAAYQGEDRVESAINSSLNSGTHVCAASIKDIMRFQQNALAPERADVTIDRVDLRSYDELLGDKERER
jgi:hypothetical protein